MIKKLIIILSLYFLPTYCMKNNNNTQQIQTATQELALEDLPKDILFYIIDQYLIDCFKHPEDFFLDVISLKKTCKKLNKLIDEFFIFVKSKYKINASSLQGWFLIMKLTEEIQMKTLIYDQLTTRISMGYDLNLLHSLQLWKYIEIERKYKNKKIINRIRKTVEEEDLNFQNSRDTLGVQRFKKKIEKIKVFLIDIMKKEDLNPDQVKWLLKLTDKTDYDEFNIELEIIKLGKNHPNHQIVDLCKNYPYLCNKYLKNHAAVLFASITIIMGLLMAINAI